jgi:hypothetical protein
LPSFSSILTRNEGVPLVVRQRSAALRTALGIATALLGLFALYVAYELGRYDAGYDRQAAAQQRTELSVQIEHLDKDNRALRTKLAELDTIRVGHPTEQAEMARTLGTLQAQVERQSQELAFYKGVVAQGANSLGIRIEQLRVTPGTRATSFVVHLALVRAGRPDNEAQGTLLFSLDGSSDGAARTLDLPALTGGRLREVRYNFRYLQNIEQELTVPAAFKPERLEVEVQSSRHDVAPLSQTFLWTVASAP